MPATTPSELGVEAAGAAEEVVGLDVKVSGRDKEGRARKGEGGGSKGARRSAFPSREKVSSEGKTESKRDSGEWPRAGTCARKHQREERREEGGTHATHSEVEDVVASTQACWVEVG